MSNGTGNRRSSTIRARDWFGSRLPIFWDNWVAAAGSVLIVVTVFLLLLLFILYLYNTLAGHESNPYVDLIGFMVLPAFLLVGLGLLWGGNLVRRRREKLGVRPHTPIDVTSGRFVRRALVVTGVTFAMLVGLGLFSFEAYHYTDSNQFCSYVCHEVMAPEAMAHSTSPHAKVKCVECHIGPGTSWFVRAKLSGIRQVFAVLTDDFSRPIPTPVHNLRPARDTCEICHWPERFHGSRLVTHPRFDDDEENTAQTTALVLHVGGPETQHQGSAASGIHWHVDPKNQVRYRHVDSQRQEIMEVVQSTPEGDIRYFRDADADSADGEWRTMDCLDCHNRPTHIYDLPHRALDTALTVGSLDASIPWLRKEAERLLRELEPNEDTETLISERLRAIYAEEHPEALAALEAKLQPTAAELTRILERNVWPAMNITWGTYASNLSHFDSEGEFGEGGCFRCHDGGMTTAEGEEINSDCDACHALLAVEEADWEGFEGLGMEAFLRR